MQKRVLVPRILDENSIKAQDINAIEIIARFHDDDITYKAFYSNFPHSKVEKNGTLYLSNLVFGNPSIHGRKYNRLKRKVHLTLHEVEMFFRYFSPADAIFYPSERNIYIMSILIRNLFNKIPIITTLEGMYGDKRKERIFSEIVGHRVHMIPIKKRKKLLHIQNISDHIITISPILKKYVNTFFHRDCSVLPLGVDTDIFFKSKKSHRKKIKIICAGRISKFKRPDFFIQLASLFSDCEFIWFGEGPMRKQVEALMRKNNLVNISFPGSLSNMNLAKEMRAADIFAFTSISEGWGKVIQEAQASGLPVVAFGYYETPLIEHGKNGYLAWNDEEFIAYIDLLINNQNLRSQIGSRAALEARKFSWENIAPLWEEKLKEILNAI